MAEYVVLDFETGGTDAKKHGLVSVGAIVLDDKLTEKERFYTIIHDYEDKPIDDEALRVNGVTREELAKGMPVEKVWGIIYGMLDDRVLVCHNAAFDAGFLKARGMDIETAVDTMDLSWKMWPYQKAKLGIVYHRMFGKQLDGAHNAMADVEAAADMLRWFVKEKGAEWALTPQKIDYDRWKKK